MNENQEKDREKRELFQSIHAQYLPLERELERKLFTFYFSFSMWHYLREEGKKCIENNRVNNRTSMTFVVKWRQENKKNGKKIGEHANEQKERDKENLKVSK